MSRAILTIAIPTYRRPDLLRRSLGSALSQKTTTPYEVLVIENPESDVQSESRIPTESEKVCISFGSPRVRYVCNDINIGMTGNWNRCIEESIGEWITILHDDDWLSPYYVSTLFHVISLHSRVKILGCLAHVERGRATRTSSDKRPRMVQVEKISRLNFLLGNPYYASGVIFQKRLVVDIGLFNPNVYPTMDHDLWLRLCDRHNAALLLYPLLHYSVESNASMNPAALASYIANDFQQRCGLIQKDFFGLKILHLYSRAKVCRERASLERFFKCSIPWSIVESQLLKVNWTPLSRLAQFIYFPVRACIGVVVAVCAKRYILYLD